MIPLNAIVVCNTIVFDFLMHLQFVAQWYLIPLNKTIVCNAIVPQLVKNTLVFYFMF